VERKRQRRAPIVVVVVLVVLFLFLLVDYARVQLCLRWALAQVSVGDTTNQVEAALSPPPVLATSADFDAGSAASTSWYTFPYAWQWLYGNGRELAGSLIEVTGLEPSRPSGTRFYQQSWYVKHSPTLKVEFGGQDSGTLVVRAVSVRGSPGQDWRQVQQ
jgi:hypothetical protein